MISQNQANLETSIGDWGQNWNTHHQHDQIPVLQRIFFNIGQMSEDPVYIGSWGSRELNEIKNRNPKSCFYPEAYGISAKKSLGWAYEVEPWMIDAINSSFMMGVISKRKRVICTAYIGHSNYNQVDDIKMKPKSNKQVNRTIGEILLLFDAKYRPELVASNDYYKEDIDNLMKDFIVRNMNEEERVAKVRSAKRLIVFHPPEESYIESPGDKEKNFLTYEEAFQYLEPLETLRDDQKKEIRKIFGKK